MIPSVEGDGACQGAVYQRGWMIDSQLELFAFDADVSISKGMDD